jgi:hypothetical protein
MDTSSPGLKAGREYFGLADKNSDTQSNHRLEIQRGGLHRRQLPLARARALLHALGSGHPAGNSRQVPLQALGSCAHLHRGLQYTEKKSTAKRNVRLSERVSKHYTALGCFFDLNRLNHPQTAAALQSVSRSGDGSRTGRRKRGLGVVEEHLAQLVGRLFDLAAAGDFFQARRSSLRGFGSAPPPRRRPCIRASVTSPSGSAWAMIQAMTIAAIATRISSRHCPTGRAARRPSGRGNPRNSRAPSPRR